jgi:hypothetical protein
LFKSKKNIIDDEIVKLILEINKGSLKISSSIIGRSIKTLKIVTGLNSIS